MSDLINAVEILQNILKSPQHVSEISNAIRQQQPPRPSNSEVAVDDEMRRLFSSSRGAASNVNVPSVSFERSTVRDTPRFTTRQYFSSWASKPRKRSVMQRHTNFNKDLVLLPRTSWCTVCKHATRTALHDSGNIISGFEISKTWDKMTIEREVRNNFKDKIPADVSMEFLMPCGNKLVAPKLQEGQELNGMLIFKIFRSRTIYIRPSRSLVFDSGDSGDSCVEVDCDSPESMDQSTANDDFADGMTTRARTNQASAARQMPNFEGRAVTTVNQTATSQISHDETIINQTTAVQPSSSDFNAACSLNQNASSTNDSGYAAYLSIIPSVSDVSSDDEELNRAILASIESCNMDRTDGPPAKVILQDLYSKIERNQQCRFNINRASVLDGAMRGFKRLSYNPNHSISVKFSDDMGHYEEAVDLGGPRREFLKLLMEALVQSPIFEGQEHQQNLALDSTALREDRYYVAGLAIAVSLVHGGPSPGFLSPTLFNCLVNGLESANPTLDDIADTDLYEKIKKISECSTLHDLLVDTEPLRDYLANAGCLRPLRRIEDRDVLVKDIIMFQVIHRLRGPFERFRDGLRTLGVLDAIQKHPGSFRPLLCHAPVPLTARSMEDLFCIRLSPQGSNRRVAEETVVPFWRDYLEDVEEEGGSAKLGKILAFATGADTIPPVGFSPQPSIEFLPKEATSTARLFPMANTCINCMKLPLHVSYQAFKESMEFALGNTQGFGRE